MTITVATFFLHNGLVLTPDTGIGPRGELILVPDLSSVRPGHSLGWKGDRNEGTYASLFGWFREKEKEKGENCVHDSRGILERIVRFVLFRLSPFFFFDCMRWNVDGLMTEC